jgi:predicted nucleotidyltransferase component of viral defense system
MHAVLAFVGEQPLARRFYLAGGTALALRLGHRRSVDLDFFSETDELLADTRRAVTSALAPLEPETLESTGGNLLLRVSGIHTGFFAYGFPLLEPPDELLGLRVAALVDIGLMKLDALIDRGTRKDFYDVYAIAQQVALGDLLARAREKYPAIRNFPIMVAESLVLFEPADRDVQPDLLVDLPWERVREFFLAEARALGRSWFGGS